jgi:hypothetical protein
MTAILLRDPPEVLQDWLERRRALGQDGHDEMWDGVYHVAPMAHGRQGRVQLLVDPQERSVEWFVRGPDGFVASDASALLGVSAREVRDGLDWPA